jgi:hypothetical protein
MQDEHYVAVMWGKLFRDQKVTSETLSEAESLVDSLHAESPLRLRLATELEQIRRLHE